jgi:predicted ATP-dependent endonuclease of OLD family
MKLKSLVIRNFRGIEVINFTLDLTANVIVGPNAVGKTTILEALRLVKGTLAPRTSDENQYVFTSLGAFSTPTGLLMEGVTTASNTKDIRAAIGRNVNTIVCYFVGLGDILTSRPLNHRARISSEVWRRS